MREEAKTLGESIPLAKDDILRLAKWQVYLQIIFFSYLLLLPIIVKIIKSVAATHHSKLLLVAYIVVGSLCYIANVFFIYQNRNFFRNEIIRAYTWAILPLIAFLAAIVIVFYHIPVGGLVTVIIRCSFLLFLIFMYSSMRGITKALRANGIRVGLLGANRSDLALFKSKP